MIKFIIQISLILLISNQAFAILPFEDQAKGNLGEALSGRRDCYTQLQDPLQCEESHTQALKDVFAGLEQFLLIFNGGFLNPFNDTFKENLNAVKEASIEATKKKCDLKLNMLKMKTANLGDVAPDKFDKILVARCFNSVIESEILSIGKLMDEIVNVSAGQKEEP